jgi:hypothetical protein
VSVTFTTSDWLDRAEAWDYNAAYTVSMWVNFPAGQGATIFGIGPVSGTTDGEGLDQQSLPDSFGTETKVSGTYDGGVTGATTPNTGTWYFIAMRRLSSTVVDLYVSTAVDGTGSSFSVAGRAAAGKFGFPTWFDWANGAWAGSIAQVRVWTTNLTDGELATEKAWTTARHTANLWAEYRLVDAAGATTDNSGNSRTLTSHGSPTTGGSDPTGQSSDSATPATMWLY